MSSETEAQHYTRSAILLHWLTVALITVSVCLGLYMVELKLSPLKLKLYSWHKWVGVTIFLIAAARLIWRAWHPAPAPPVNSPPWQRAAAAINHWALYALLICIPISGWLMSSAFGVTVKYFGVIPLPDLVEKNKELAESLKVAARGAGVHDARPGGHACRGGRQASCGGPRRRPASHAAARQAASMKVLLERSILHDSIAVPRIALRSH